MGSLVVLTLLYIGAIFADFIAPYEKNYRIPDVQFSSPTRVRVYEPGKGFSRPFVFAVTRQLDMKTFTYETVIDRSQKWYLRFFVNTDPYKLLRFIPVSHRLFGVDTGYISLFGTDNLGIDILSQTLYASRISLSVGLVGVAISFVLGVILGGISGYFGGTVDEIIQRIIEFIITLPQLPLWIALSAARPEPMDGHPDLLRHHGHPLVGRLDESCARGARPADLDAGGRLRPWRRGLPGAGTGPLSVFTCCRAL